MHCADVTENLSAWLDGELTAAEQEEIRVHLETCARCRSDLEALRRTIGAVAGLPGESAPTDLRARVMKDIATESPSARAPLWRVFWPAAAALLIGVAISLFYPTERQRVSRPMARRTAEYEMAKADKDVPAFRAAPGEPSTPPALAPALAEDAMARDDVQSAARPMLEAESFDRAESTAVPAHSRADVEIAIRTDDAAAALARTRKILDERGWAESRPAREAGARARTLDAAAPNEIVVELAAQELAVLRHELVRAKLLPTPPEAPATVTAPTMQKDALDDQPPRRLHVRITFTPPD